MNRIQIINSVPYLLLLSSYNSLHIYEVYTCVYIYWTQLIIRAPCSANHQLSDAPIKIDLILTIT